MSIGREELKQIVDALGRARSGFLSAYGDTNKSPGAQLRLESSLCRLRGATVFHDDDYVSDLFEIGGQDVQGFGAVGSRFEANHITAIAHETLPPATPWSPRYYGPPSPEGFSIWGYNAWSTYRVTPQSGNSEPSYETRYDYTYPIRYTGSSYSRVAMWERARWLSVLNDTGSTIGASSAVVRFVLSADSLAGVRARDPATGRVLDAKLYGHSSLVQSYSGSWENIAVPSYGALLELCECEVILRADGDYDVGVVFPYAIPNGKYAHLALYWCTDDDYAISIDSTISTVAPDLEGLTVVPWSLKNFFRNDINTRAGWEGYGVNDDTNGYLVARSRTHFAFLDGKYGAPDAPAKYATTDIEAAAPVGADDSLTGYADALMPGEVVPIVVASKMEGTSYEGGSASSLVLVGPKMSAQFWTSDWADLPYYPSVPDDHVETVRLVLGRAPGAVHGLVEAREGSQNTLVVADGGEAENNEFEVDTLYAKASVWWLSQSAPSFALPPIGDADLAASLLGPLIRATQRLRLYDDDTPLTKLAFALIPRSAGLSRSMQGSLALMQDASSAPSVALRGELKSPTIDILLPDSGYVAFEFDDDSRDVIRDIAGAPPSTVMLRLDSDVATLSGERLSTPNSFELYLDSSDQCLPISLDLTGDRIGQDYTLRLVLEDASENLLTKDWYVTASKFYLSDAEYSGRLASGLSVTGYFKSSTLKYMPEFRLHGYAGVVPDLSMGDSIELLTRVVSPPDETRVTEEQFRKNLENQGYSEEEINDAVLEFLNSGGQFLVIDLRQYDNQFTALRSAALCVSKLAFQDRPYWINNIRSGFGLPNEDSDVVAPPTPANMRADSFTVAPAGLQAGVLESFGNQSIGAGDPALDMELSLGSDRPFIGDRVAMRMVTDDGASFTSVGLRLKVTGYSGDEPSPRPGAKLRASIWSSEDGLPSQVLFVGGEIEVDSISYGAYDEYQIPIVATLQADIVYWLVLEKDSEMLDGDFVSLETRVDPSPEVDSWAYDNVDGWRPAQGAWWLTLSNGLDEVDPPAFDWEESGFDEWLVFPKSATALAASDEFDRVTLSLGFTPVDGNTTGGLLNASTAGMRVKVVLDDFGEPSDDLQATSAIVRFSTLGVELAEIEFILDTAVPAGTYWLILEPTVMPAGGYLKTRRVGYTSGQMASHEFGGTWNPQSSDAYRKFYAVPIEPFAAFNRGESNIVPYLPPANDQRTYVGVNQRSATYKVEGYWQYALTWPGEPSELAIYPRAFYNSTTPAWEYAPYSRDIFVKLKLLVDGRIVEKDTIRLEGAPSWLASFWKKTSSSYKSLDVSDTPDSRRVVAQLDFVSHDESGLLGQYYNATFEGYFRPLYDGDTYTLVLQADAGAKVFFGDDPEPVIDTWDEPVMSPVSYTIPYPLEQDVAYRVYVEYYRAGGSQRMELFWYPSALPTPVYLGTSSALVVPPTPISLGPELASGIAYLAVGKTAEELDTFTDGAPPGDRLVLRSS